MHKVRRHLFSRDLANLRRINDPDVDLAVWVRRAPPAAKRFARFSPFALLPNMTFSCRVPVVRAAVRNALPPGAGKGGAAFADDVAYLAALFRCFTGAENVRVRIERVDADGCRLFHADRVKVRLVCTYRGPGTEWLPEHAVDRDGLRQGSNDLIVRNRDLVRHLRPYAVALMKGELAAGKEFSGLIHRSPPVRCFADARLLVVIDDADVAYR